MYHPVPPPTYGLLDGLASVGPRRPKRANEPANRGEEDGGVTRVTPLAVTSVDVAGAPVMSETNSARRTSGVPSLPPFCVTIFDFFRSLSGDCIRVEYAPPPPGEAEGDRCVVFSDD